MLFADDAAVVVLTQMELQSLMDSSSQACKDFGLTISLKKTNVLGQDTEAPLVITIDDYKLDAVCQFTYLGSTTTDNLHCDAEIDKRIGKADSTLARLTARVWTSPKLSMKQRWQSTMHVLPAHCCMAARHGLHTPGRREGSTHSTREASIVSLEYPGKIKYPTMMFCLVLVFQDMNPSTVEPVLGDHPFCPSKAVSQDRWSLIAGRPKIMFYRCVNFYRQPGSK